MSLKEIKNDIKTQELDDSKKYVLNEGVHVLFIDLNSKEKYSFEYENKPLYYHKFNIINNKKEYVLLSTYAYVKLLKAITPIVNRITDKNPIIETIINVSKSNGKINYEIQAKESEIK